VFGVGLSLGWFCVLFFVLGVFCGCFWVGLGVVLLLFSYWFAWVVLGLFWIFGCKVIYRLSFLVFSWFCLRKVEFIYLSQEDVVGLEIPMGRVIELVEGGLSEHGHGRVENPPKPGIHSRPDAFIHAMPAY